VFLGLTKRHGGRIVGVFPTPDSKKYRYADHRFSVAQDRSLCDSTGAFWHVVEPVTSPIRKVSFLFQAQHPGGVLGFLSGPFCCLALSGRWPPRPQKKRPALWRESGARTGPCAASRRTLRDPFLRDPFRKSAFLRYAFPGDLLVGALAGATFRRESPTPPGLCPVGLRASRKSQSRSLSSRTEGRP